MGQGDGITGFKLWRAMIGFNCRYLRYIAGDVPVALLINGVMLVGACLDNDVVQSRGGEK
jgi:hypothetical protein